MYNQQGMRADERADQTKNLTGVKYGYDKPEGKYFRSEGRLHRRRGKDHVRLFRRASGKMRL